MFPSTSFILLSLIALGVRLGCMFEIFFVSWGMIVLLINFPPRTAFSVFHGVLILCFNFHLSLGIFFISSLIS